MRVKRDRAKRYYGVNALVCITRQAEICVVRATLAQVAFIVADVVGGDTAAPTTVATFLLSHCCPKAKRKYRAPLTFY